MRNNSCFTKYPGRWWEVWSALKWYVGNLKCAWQRAVRGYSDRDTWNLDEFYAKVFSGSLRSLAEIAHGCPDSFYDKENDSIEAWTEYLNDIAEAFEAYTNRKDAGNPYEDEYYAVLTKMEKEFGMPEALVKDVPEEYRELKEHYYEWARKHEHKVEENIGVAFEMLSKVFSSLWD